MLPFELKTPRCRCLFSFSFFFGLVCCINYSLIAKRCIIQKQFKFTLNSDRWQFLLYLRRPGRIKVQPCPPTNQFDRSSIASDQAIVITDWFCVWCDVMYDGLCLPPIIITMCIYTSMQVGALFTSIASHARRRRHRHGWCEKWCVCVCVGSWSILTGIQSSRIV